MGDGALETARRYERRQESAETSALIFATSASANGGPAAALPVGDSMILAHLLDQLESLGMRRAWVVTRPNWKATVEAAAAGGGVDVTVVAAEDVGDDLRMTAEIAGQTRGRLIVGNAHVLTHREALAGLLADPRIVSGVLATGSHMRAHWSFPIRSMRRRVVSAASAFHRVKRPTGYFLGVMKIDARDRDRLVAASRELAKLAADRPQRWEEEFERKTREWRRGRWRAKVQRETGIAPDPADYPDPDSIRLDATTEAELALRRRVAAEDPVALLLVGLVRNEVDLFPSNLRGFFYATPLSAQAAALAVKEMTGYDEDRLLLESAVKANDGFFTTFFVSPYSKYLARFAARRGWTPNAVTTLSLAIGVAAAASFAVGNRVGLIVGAVLLQVSFTVDCIDGQLARYTRTFSKLGAWLDSVFDRTKEYLVYGGLAIGSVRGFGDDVWILAAAALTLQTVRHMSDFAYVARQRDAIAATPTLPPDQPEDVPPAAGGPSLVAPGAQLADAAPRRRLARHAVDALRALTSSRAACWGNRIIRMPIGERFALISLTAAIATPRVTFVALLVWGGVAAAYAVAVRILISYAVPQRIVRAVTK